MTRSALIVTAFGVLASTPAFALTLQKVPAAGETANYGFINVPKTVNLVPGATSIPYHDPAQAKPDAKTVVYHLPPGKPAARIDVTSPKDNPFMAH